MLPPLAPPRRAARKPVLLASWRRFCEVLPEMRRPGCAALLCGGAALGSSVCVALGWMAGQVMPHGTLLVQAILLASGQVGMHAGFWSHRAAYRQRYGALAYRQLFYRFLLPSLVVTLAAGCFPLLVTGRRLLSPLIAYALITYLLVSARLIEMRGTEVFWNIELRAFVCSVFPERGQVLTSGIFHWLRHPVYSTMIRTVLVLALLRNTLSAFACVALSTLGLWLWARAEEQDSEERDPTYTDYRRRVPAFFVLPPLRFWRFLVTGTD